MHWISDVRKREKKKKKRKTTMILAEVTGKMEL